jgi:hypothetical protein
MVTLQKSRRAFKSSFFCIFAKKIMTFREVAYIVSDFSKTISDDSTISIDHIMFLITKYRNYILNQQYLGQKREIGDGNYQNICVNLQRCNAGDFCDAKDVLKSTSKLPYTLTFGSKIVYPTAGFIYGNIQFVNNNRFKHVGYNRFFKNTIYATIAPDGYMYLRSANENFMFLDKVIMTALFSESKEAAMIECNENGDCVECDVLDKRFPLDDSFLPMLLKMTVEDVVGASWRPKDDENNAQDDIARFAKMLELYTNTTFKNIVKNNKRNAAKNKDDDDDDDDK